MYRIRLDIINDLNADQLIQACQPTSHVIVRHELPHGNPHYHAYVVSDVKENTLRQRIKRLDLNLKSTDYSIKKCTPDRTNEYVQYMFNTKHGNKWELIDSHNFDDQLLHQLQIQAKAITDEFTHHKTSKSHKPTMYDLAMEVRQRFTQIHNISNNPVENLGKHQAPEGYIEYREHLELAIKVCRKYNQAFEENYLRRLVTTALCEGQTGRQTIISKIMNKEFRDY